MKTGTYGICLEHGVLVIGEYSAQGQTISEKMCTACANSEPIDLVERTFMGLAKQGLVVNVDGRWYLVQA